MPSKEPKQKQQLKAKSTQSFLKVAEVRSDTMILEDGKFCAILAVASTNYALKNPEEQKALIFGYQNFLNQLDFDVQILMQSRKMNIDSYLDGLRKLMEEQSNELLRVQTAEYIEFIGKLIESSSVMSKNFYVVVAYWPGDLEAQAKPSGSGGGIFGIFRRGNAKQEISDRLKKFDESKQKLDQRVTTVAGGLASLGLKSAQLNTQAIIELVYNSYNFEAGPLIDASKLADIKLDT
jgi:hypothetical protein